jgi:hypothetical protein
MSLAVLVQMKGLGSSFQCETHRSMASVRASTLLNDPVRRRLLVSCANQPSTRFSHEERECQMNGVTGLA